MGVALYWAEGSKEKNSKTSQVRFTNSDPKMVGLFIKWSHDCAGISKKELDFSLYIHENNKHRLKVIKNFWSKELHVPIYGFQKIYYKKHPIRIVRKKIGDDYFGLIRVTVKKSSILNRKITGWINAINQYYR